MNRRILKVMVDVEGIEIELAVTTSLIFFRGKVNLVTMKNLGDTRLLDLMEDRSNNDDDKLTLGTKCISEVIKKYKDVFIRELSNELL